ncbi:MAG: hypothetical protein OQK04_19325 [Kangiellaceae bacterium]|nr:hypothetical protein [Kangiellaceae bacterium]MCW9000871.1 hypothetical protein [Kangiellaceae bacterium]
MKRPSETPYTKANWFKLAAILSKTHSDFVAKYANEIKQKKLSNELNICKKLPGKLSKNLFQFKKKEWFELAKEFMVCEEVIRQVKSKGGKDDNSPFASVDEIMESTFYIDYVITAWEQACFSYAAEKNDSSQ